ncbi:MAG: large-conductance mechanosensitive channel protein MscL [Bacteroidota bacterium]
MKNFIKDFKEFAVKGNLVDLAIGIIIGTAFNKIVSSLVKDVIMPPFGLVFGEKGFTEYIWTLQEANLDENGEVISEAVVISYGTFLQHCLDFLIVALTIFVVIRLFNKLKNKAEDEAETSVPTPKDIQLLAEIRDLMKNQNEYFRDNFGKQ